MRRIYFETCQWIGWAFCETFFQYGDWREDHANADTETRTDRAMYRLHRAGCWFYGRGEDK